MNKLQQTEYFIRYGRCNGNELLTIAIYREKDIIEFRYIYKAKLSSLQNPNYPKDFIICLDSWKSCFSGQFKKIPREEALIYLL